MELSAETEIYFALGYAHDTMIVALSTCHDNASEAVKRAGIDKQGLMSSFSASAMGEHVEWSPRNLVRVVLREAIPRMVLGPEPPEQLSAWLFVAPEAVSLLHCYGCIEKSNNSFDALYHFRLLERDSFFQGFKRYMGDKLPLDYEHQMARFESLLRAAGHGSALWIGSTRVIEPGSPPKTLFMNSGTVILRPARISRLISVMPLAGYPHQRWTMSSRPEGCNAFANFDAEENPSVFPVELLAGTFPGEKLRLDVFRINNATEMLIDGFGGFPEILSSSDERHAITEETPIKLASILNEHHFPLGVLVLSARSFWIAHPIEVEVEGGDPGGGDQEGAE